jgi:hypothetical protein
MTFGLVLLAGAWPLWRLWRANLRTSLLHAVGWCTAAWVAWLAVLFAPEESTVTVMPALQYVALSLTGCAGIAVLGARRPGVGAWNLVVAALLALDLLPLLESAFADRALSPGGLRILGVAGTMIVGIINYLPTRFWAAALAALTGSSHCLTVLFFPQVLDGLHVAQAWIGPGCIALVPWFAYLAASPLQTNSSGSALHFWLEFRDRFGYLWSERLREQFNRSALHAGWPVRLRWGAIESTNETALSPDLESKAAATLQALMKRFSA